MWFNPATPMDASARNALLLAFSGITAEVRSLPTGSLDWKPPGNEWSCREIVAHAAHAHDFYVMICEQVVKSGFGVVKLTRSLPGYRVMVRTNKSVKTAASAEAAASILEDRFMRLFGVLDGFGEEVLERPFTLSLDWSNEPAHSTTLRKRVIDVSTAHLVEHRAQLAETVTQWRRERPA